MIMKNTPKKIYLNVGSDNLGFDPNDEDTDFIELVEVTWSEGAISNGDIEYILATPALKAAHDERQRQIEKEGYDAKHDDDFERGELALAACSYAETPESRRQNYFFDKSDYNKKYRKTWPSRWPWHPKFWKPTPDDRKREIAKAMALLIAEYERIERKEVKS